MPSSTGSKILRSFCGATRPLTAPRSWQYDARFPPADGCRGVLSSSFSVSGAGEVAGITYTAAGRGTPALLLPLGLSSRQWEPVLPRLQAHHCTIVLGGPYLKPMEQLESRAEGGYARMALQLLDLAKPHASEALIEVGCGTGALLRRIVRHTGMPQVTGLDINGFLLKEAQALAVQEGLGERLIFQQGSAEAVPFPDNAFDIVYSCTVMEEVDADRSGGVSADCGAWGPCRGGRTRRRPWPMDQPPAAGATQGKDRSASRCSGRWRWHERPGLRRRKPLSALAARRLAGDRRRSGLGLGTPHHGVVADEPGAPDRSMLTPVEEQTWLHALQQAQADGLPVWIARPFHCAVGTKP